MLVNDTCQPIDCDDYSSLELACQHHLMLTLELKDDGKSQAKANGLVSRKSMEYLVVEAAGTTHELHLDKVTSLSHPEIDTMVMSESWLTFAGCDV